MPKENDGRRSRRRTFGRIMLALLGGGALTVVTIVVFVGLRSNNRVVTTGLSSRSRLRSKALAGFQKRIRSSPKQKLSSSSSSPPADRDDIDSAILRGEYTLINVRTGMTSLQATSGESDGRQKDYKDVMGAFCKIDWALQAKNPAKVAMFRDLQAASGACQEVSRDLGSMVQKMRQYDLDHAGEVISLPPSAVVFHETRCGSTLVANLFAAAKPNNEHYVYSESPPPLAALQACDNARQCDADKHVQLIQDVFYVMGRRKRPEHDKPLRVFYKIQSVGSHSIGAFTKAFPSTPWFFIFRDSVEVMMSHVDPDQHTVQRWAVCLRSRNWEPKPALAELIKKKGKSVTSLSNEQFCAAHLASLCLSALNEYHNQSSAVGHFINYQQLPDILWESVLPNILKIPLDSEDVERMKRVAGVYSKGRFEVQSWEQDSQKKRKEAPLAVQSAATEYMGDAYERLQQVKMR